MASNVVVALTVEELKALPAVVPLRVAARAWGMGLSKAGELVRAGEFPHPGAPIKVLHVGRKGMVRKVDLMRSLGLRLDGTPLEASPEPGAA